MVVRVALITGGTRGLGRSISVQLARDGFVPAMVYHSNEAARDEALEAIRRITPEARAFAADITQAAAVEQTVSAIESEMGPIHALINNAYRGGRPPLKTHEVPPEDFLLDLVHNLASQFLVTRAVLPYMRARQFGRIVFIGSLAMRGEPGRVAYATAKSGLVGLAKTVAREYAKEGITANVLSPGFVDAGAFQRLPETIQTRALASVPSKRAARAEEVAALVSYLVSENAGYTTGQVFKVDGGAP